MQSYQVETTASKEILISKTLYNDTVQIGFSLPKEYQVDQDYFKESYGLEICQYEINYYYAQIILLKDFLSSEESWCFVHEKGVKISNEMNDVIRDLYSVPTNTELFFPFDKLKNLPQISSPPLASSRCGHFWGSYIYLISRSGAEKVLSRTSIDRPFDETLLSMSLSDELITVCADVDWFQYDEQTCISYQERNKSVKDAIFNHPAWTHSQKLEAKELLHNLVKHANTLGIKLMPHAGTLLGCVRHGGIMPWDDDIDLSIMYEDLQVFLDLITSEGLIKYTTWIFKRTGETYYKFWKEGGETVSGYDYSFPFIDFWLVYKEEDFVYMTDGYKFDKNKYMDLIEIDFEGCKLNIQRQPEIILDTMYKNWRRQIQVFSWSHRTKTQLFKPLHLDIEVDQFGRMLNLFDQPSI